MRTIVGVIAGYLVMALLIFATFSAAYLLMGADAAFMPGSRMSLASPLLRMAAEEVQHEEVPGCCRSQQLGDPGPRRGGDRPAAVGQLVQRAVPEQIRKPRRQVVGLQLLVVLGDGAEGR